MVMLEVTRSGGSPLKRTSKSFRVETATPPFPTPRDRMVGVVAHQGRLVEGRSQAGHAVLQQVLEALVRVLRRSESGELAHRPQPPPVHARLRPPRVGELPRKPQRALVPLDVRVTGVAD